MNNSKIKILLLIPLILIICFLAYTYLSKGDLSISDDTASVETKTYVENNFKLRSRYVGDNTWDYTIEGKLPNPCYNAKISITVAESYPEQVNALVTITPPKKDMACIEVIQDFTESGSFSASDQANIELNVTESNSL